MTEKPDTKQEGGNHYLRMAIQPARYLQLNMITWNLANVIKYVCRYKNKGNPLLDLRKALHYAQMQIQLIDEGGLSGGKVVAFRISPETFCLANDLSANITDIVCTASRYPWDIKKLDGVCTIIETLLEEYAEPTT